eukprot:1662728-Heterocapsa_arctica.AAC.2
MRSRAHTPTLTHSLTAMRDPSKPRLNDRRSRVGINTSHRFYVLASLVAYSIPLLAINWHRIVLGTELPAVSADGMH